MRALTLPGCVAVLASLGCATVTTGVKLRDPREVTLQAPDGRTLLPPGSEPAAATVDSGALSMGAYSTTAYEVQAVREPSGALTLRWITRSVLRNGESHVLLAPDGTLPPLAMPGSELGLPRAPQASSPSPSPSLVVPECGSLQLPSRGSFLASTGEACPPEGGGSYRASLVTPWSNVVAVTEVRDYHNLQSSGGDAFAAGFFGVLATIALAATDTALAVGMSQGWVSPVVGGVGIGATVALEAALVFAAFRPTQRTVLYPLAPDR
jgi:hypothetical protein